MSEVQDRPEVADEVVDAAPTINAVAVLSPLKAIETGLAALAAEKADWNLATAEGDKAARAYRAKCVAIRTKVKDAYETLNRPLLDMQKDARKLVADITAAVEKLEEPVDALIKAQEAIVEQRRAAKRAEAEAEERRKQAEERARIEAIQLSIDEIRAAATGHGKAPASQLADAIATVEALPMTEEVYAEYLTAARRAHENTLQVLRDMHGAAVERERAEAELAAQRAALAEQQRQANEAAALAKRKAEAEEAARRAAQAKIDAEAAEARRLADEKAAADRAEADRIAAEKRAAEQAELDRQRAEQAAAQAKLDAERREREEKEVAERKAREEAEAAERAERERIEREEREAREKAERERLAAEAAALSRLRLAARSMLDALKQWKHAEDRADVDELACARKSRDAAITEATGEPA
mgnify:FL=1